MAQIIVTAIGSAGDIHPLVGIGRALAARGHRIVFCTHPPFEPAARREGFEFVAIGHADHYAAALANPALWNPRTSFRTLWELIAPLLRPHYDTLVALTGPDTVLVGTLWAFSARLMQERRGTPYVSVQVSPSTLLSAYAPPVHKQLTIPRGLPLPVKAALMTLIERTVLDTVCAPRLNELRAALGLPPVTRILGRWLHSPEGVLCLFPDWFAAPQPDWPKPYALSGFPLFNDLADAAPDAELEAFIAAGEPPVVFTAGSTLVDSERYAQAVAHALRTIGARGLLLGGALRDDIPPSLRLLRRRYVPLRSLLPRCRALVHHGGIGTASLAFEAGIPQVVTPFAHDQFDNAQRVADTGCGLRCDAALDGAGLAHVLGRVLHDPRIAAYCAQACAKLAAAPDGCEQAANFIERFVPSAARDTAAAAPAQPERSPECAMAGRA
jgi:rhamnosyltransferase subunit B